MKNFLNYKKPAFWVVAVCVIAVAAVGIGLAANLKSEPLPSAETAEYSITKHGKNGDTTAENSAENMELARDIVMDVLAKSAAWEGVDISTLDEYYLIRPTFAKTGETHDYYAFRLADDTEALQKDTAVLQRGKDGRYSAVSDDLYSQMADLF